MVSHTKGTQIQGTEEENIWMSEEGKWQEAGEDCIMGSFITCMLHQILLG
jgi:hypothetical protein